MLIKNENLNICEDFGFNITPEAIVRPIIMLGAIDGFSRTFNLQSFTPKNR